jgi:hypothetical protein
MLRDVAPKRARLISSASLVNTAITTLDVVEMGYRVACVELVITAFLEIVATVTFVSVRPAGPLAERMRIVAAMAFTAIPPTHAFSHASVLKARSAQGQRQRTIYPDAARGESVPATAAV